MVGVLWKRLSISVRKQGTASASASTTSVSVLVWQLGIQPRKGMARRGSKSQLLSQGLSSLWLRGNKGWEDWW